MGIVLLVIVAFLGAAILRAAWQGKTRAADRDAQLKLVKDATGVTLTAEVVSSEIVLAACDDRPINLETTTQWQAFESYDLLGHRFPDGSVSVTRLRMNRSEGEKPTYARLTRDTKLSSPDGSRTFDRCGVGLLRLAGIIDPVRLPHAVDYDTSGKASRPVAKVTAEAVITYLDATHTPSTRRISVLGFEPIGTRRHTDEVRLHAWCWDRKDYRTFNLSRVRSLMEPASSQQINKKDWAWCKGGLKFPPSDKLT